VLEYCEPVLQIRQSWGRDGLSKPVHELIRPASHEGVKNGSVVVVRRISKIVSLRLEDKSSGLDLLP
jgi:hypothetical protein